MKRERVARVAALLGLSSLALAAALFVPRSRNGAQRALEVVLVDVSASELATRPNWDAWIERELVSRRDTAARDDASFAVIAFGRAATRVFGPGTAREFEPRAGQLVERAQPLGASDSNVAAALEVARGLDPTRVVLVGDATYEGADPKPALRLLADRGVVIELVAPPARERANARLERLETSPRVALGTPLALRADVAFEGLETAATPQAFLSWKARDSNAREVRTGREPIDLALVGASDRAGFRRGSVVASIEPPAGDEIEIEARVELVDALTNASIDVSSDDDARAVLVRIAGSVRVAVLGTGAETLAQRLNARTGISAFVTTAANLTRDLTLADVVIALDIAEASLEADAIASFVRHGGGLVDAAGVRWLASPRDARLAALEPSGSADEPRDVVFLVDASGSMAGAAFEEVRAALALLVEGAVARDRLELATFARDLSAAILLRAANEDSNAARARLSTLPPPTGPTRLLGALEALRARVTGGKQALVVVLSDGREAEREGVLERARAVRSSFTGAGTKLCIVAASNDPDLELLGALAGDSASVLRAGALDRAGASVALTRLLERELAREQFLESRGAPIELARAHGLLPALEALAPPRLERLLRTRAAVGAQAAWVTPSGEVALASRRVGLGLVLGLAWTLDESVDDDATVFEALVRCAAPPADLERALARIEDGEIVVEDPSGTLAPVAPATLALSGREFDLELVADGFDPLRKQMAQVPRAAFEFGGERTAKLRVSDADGEPLVLALTLPQAPEFDGRSRFVDVPSIEAHTGLRERSIHRLAPYALALALASLSIFGLASFVRWR